MACEVRIGGTAYSAADDFSIRQQAGAVSSSTVTVRVDAQPTPQPLQSAQVLIDGTPAFYGLITTVNYPTRSTGYEPKTYTLEIQSIEAIFNFRHIKRNWYNKRIDEIVQDIFTYYLAEEGITLGEISETTAEIGAYRQSYAKIGEILDDLAGRLDGASYYISPDKKFYFLVRDDFTIVQAPERVSEIQKSVAYGDIRTIQIVRGASAGIVGQATNTALQTILATRSGTSGKIESIASDSTIHNPTKAGNEATDTLQRHAEEEVTIRCLCRDIAKSAPFTAWTISETYLDGEDAVASKWPADLRGEFVVTERTITPRGTGFQIAVTLKNRNYFARYGYSIKTAAQAGAEANGKILETNSDNWLTPDKKIQAKSAWLVAVGEAAVYDADADEYGITTEKATYDAALQAVADILNDGDPWTTGLPLYLQDDRIAATEEIDGPAYQAAWQAYHTARLALAGAISEARRASAVQEATESMSRYLGPFEFPAAPDAPVKGDTYLRYSTTSGSEYRGLYKYDPEASPAWQRTVDPAELSQALRDIADLTVTSEYGTEADYGVLAIDVAHIRAALVDKLAAGDVTVRGTIDATAGRFSGKLDAPDLKTVQAQTPNVITPAATHWLGSKFVVDKCSGAANGITAATGTFSGKTVVSIVKGNTISYYYPGMNDDAEDYYESNSSYQTKRTLIASMTGRARVYFEASFKNFPAASDSGARILHNGVVVFTYETDHVSGYQEKSVELNFTAGDTIELQTKCGVWGWVLQRVWIKNFRISPVADTIGVNFSDSTAFVVESSHYYTTPGNIDISGATDFIIADKLEYYLGEQLFDLLNAAGASIYNRNELEEDGWSETYQAVIANVYAGKSCNAYEMEPDRVIIYNTDLTTTSIYISQMYAYSATNKLYLQSKTGAVIICGHQYQDDAEPNIHRKSNIVPSIDNSHYSVESLDGPRVDWDANAKFESTRAKLIHWHDGAYHSFVCDDSLHNLVESGSTVTFDASAKTISKSSNWNRRLIGPGEFLRIKGSTYNGGSNNGYYRCIQISGNVLYYDNTMLATPVSCSDSCVYRYPVRQLWINLNFGSSADTHKPRFQWIYQKNEVAEYLAEIMSTTKRFTAFGGRGPAGAIHNSSTTLGALFAALSPVLLYVGETMLLHGTIIWTVYNPISESDVTYKITATYCEMVSSSTIRVYGTDSSGVNLTTRDLTSGDTQTAKATIAW